MSKQIVDLNTYVPTIWGTFVLDKITLFTNPDNFTTQKDPLVYLSTYDADTTNESSTLKEFTVADGRFMKYVITETACLADDILTVYDDLLASCKLCIQQLTTSPDNTKENQTFIKQQLIPNIELMETFEDQVSQGQACTVKRLRNALKKWMKIASTSLEFVRDIEAFMNDPSFKIMEGAFLRDGFVNFKNVQTKDIVNIKTYSPSDQQKIHLANQYYRTLCKGFVQGIYWNPDKSTNPIEQPIGCIQSLTCQPSQSADWYSKQSSVLQVVPLMRLLSSFGYKTLDTQQAMLGGAAVDIEQEIEHSYTFQCLLSKDDKLHRFIACLFIKLTMIVRDALMAMDTSDNEQDKIQRVKGTLLSYYRPDTYIDNTGTYVLKPGMLYGPRNRRQLKGFIDFIMVERDIERLISQIQDTFSMNEIMGAFYGVLVNPGVFTLIYRASIEHPENSVLLMELNTKFEQVLSGLKSVFALDKHFTHTDFIEMLRDDDSVLQTNKTKDYNSNQVQVQTNAYKINKGFNHNIVLDMIFLNPYTRGQTMMLKTNLHNRDYVRDKTTPNPYNAEKGNLPKSKIKSPSCPTFYNVRNRDQKALDGNIWLVQGDEWSQVKPNSIFAKVAQKYGRTVKAGPSGSTFLYMNMVFGILGVKPTPENHKLLLLSIICDFVPTYHSLPEVLMVYSQENIHINDSQRYTMSENPAEWVMKHLRGLYPAEAMDDIVSYTHFILEKIPYVDVGTIFGAY